MSEESLAVSAKGPSTVLLRALPWLITVAAGWLCYGLFWRRGIWLSVIGYNVAPADRVLNGEIPYRDFLYNYTPGTLWLNALLMKVFGKTLLTINAGLLVFKLGVLLTLVAAGRLVVGAWLALVPVALTLGWLGHQYIFGVVPTQYSMPFTLLGLIALLCYNESDRTRWLFLGGLAVGVVFVFKYNVGILLLAAATAAVAIREAAANHSRSWPERVVVALKRSSLFWTGFAVCAGAMAALLASNHALYAMVDHFLHHAAQYSEERSVPLPALRLAGPVVVGFLVVVAVAAVLIRKLPRLFEFYVALVFALGAVALLYPGRAYVLKTSASAAVAYLPISLFVLTTGLAVLRLRRAVRAGEGSEQWWKQQGPAVIVGLFALGAYLEVYPRADYYHLVRVLPPVFLLMALLILDVWRWLGPKLEGRGLTPRRALLVGASALVLFLLLIGVRDTWQPQFEAGGRFIDRIPVSVERASGMMVERNQVEFIERLAGAVTANSAAEDYMFSFSQRGTGFYFLTGRRNPTRFVWWRNVGIEARDREAVLEMITNRQPRLILLQDTLTDARVRETVSTHYQQADNVDGIGVFVRRQL